MPGKGRMGNVGFGDNAVRLYWSRYMKMHLSIFKCGLMVLGLVVAWPVLTVGAETVDLSSDLMAVREEYKLPAVAAAVIVEGQLRALGVTGVRKDGNDVKVEPNDPFHLGSCTKAMTGSLIGLLVQQGKLEWDTPIVEYLPELKDTLHADYRGVTLVHLLSHRAGVPPMTAGMAPLTGFQLLRICAMMSPAAQRKRVTEIVLTQTPVNQPGESYTYSNAGFTIAGAIAETAMGEDYESLIRRLLFGPLGMHSVGFGAMGTLGTVDAPWQHRKYGDTIIPINPGLLLSDNPPFITPAGRVHCTMTDWAKYVRCILAATRDEPGLLDPASVQQLKEPPFGGSYALGWGIHERAWGGGRVFSHAGSNGMNYCVVWVAPLKDFAVMVAANRGGEGAPESLDKVCGAMIKRFLAD